MKLIMMQFWQKSIKGLRLQIDYLRQKKLMPGSADSGQSATAANLTFIHRPTKIGASRRAFTMKYKSGGRDNHHDVNDILITPYDGGERAWQLRAHEDTHKAHN